jgi:hypothetical protein
MRENGMFAIGTLWEGESIGLAVVEYLERRRANYVGTAPGTRLERGSAQGCVYHSKSSRKNFAPTP